MISHGDASPVEGDQLFGDAESQAEMLFFAPGGIRPVKTLKDMRFDFIGDTGALINYLDADLMALMPGRL